MKRCKILIIVGGGIYGCIPAHLLAGLPKPRQTLEGIDVLAGCSVGGMLAAGYAVGNPFTRVDILFRENASKCFTKRAAAKVNPFAVPKYRTDTMDEVLEDIMCNMTMGDVKKVWPNLSLIIPALDLTFDNYIVFDNVRGKYDDVALTAIAGYTSAAPSYFAGRDFRGHCLVDGGLIEVAPLLTATTCIKHNTGVPFMNMDVLMLGTGKDKDEKPLTIKRYNALGLLGIATDVLVPYATLSNEMATTYWGETLGLGSFVYFNPIQTNGKLDDVSQIPKVVTETEKYQTQFNTVWEEWLAR